MEDLAVITALNLLGSFGKNLVQFKGKKNKMLFTSLGLVRIGKNCALRLESSPFSHGLSKKERLPNNALCLRHPYLPT